AVGRLGVAAKGGRWLVVGTGGSARAVAVTAADRGASLWVRSRNADRARDFAAWGRTIGADVEVAAGAVEIDVAINATPVGLAGQASPPVHANDTHGVS